MVGNIFPKVFPAFARLILESIKEELTMKNKIIEFLKDESGQTSTEYILLVAVVAVIILKFKDKLKTLLDGLIDNVFQKANDELGNL